MPKSWKNFELAEAVLKENHEQTDAVAQGAKALEVEKQAAVRERDAVRVRKRRLPASARHLFARRKQLNGSTWHWRGTARPPAASAIARRYV